MVISTSAFAIKDRQRDVFDSVLTSPLSDKVSRHWNILVCDARSFDSLSCLFKPSQLRRHGVTLHTIIDRPRGPVPDVPATYIVSPSPENIAWLLKDLASDPPLYTSAKVCFTNFVSRPLLMALAAQLPVPAPITSVRDLYADFVSYEQNLFSLHMTGSFVQMKAIKDDVSGKLFVETIVARLFSVLLTLGVIPVIRSQRGGAAEVVSRALDKKLRDSLELFQSRSFSARALSFRRPLLLMLDRDFDFTAMLHHTWTYQALIHDCLDCKLSKVTVDMGDSTGGIGQSRKTYVLDKDSDYFWAQNASVPFPHVAESIDSALKKYREEVDEINRNAVGGSGTPDGSLGTSQLAATIAALPELTKRKETIDVHTNIATALLDNINKRALDTFFELESQLLVNANRPATSLPADEYQAAVTQLLKGITETESGEKRGAGTAADRLRLFLIYYSFFGGQLSERSMAEFKSILNSAGADTSVIEYIRKLKGFRHDLVTESQTPQGGLSTTKLRGIMTNVMSRGYRSFTNVAQSAKKLVVEERKAFPVARTVELFMSEQARSRQASTASTILDGYLLFDPKVMETPANDTGISSTAKITNGIDGEEKLTSRQRMQRMVYSDAIVFTMGGGNYVEYSNCVETVNSIPTANGKKNLLYGTTEMLTSEGFLRQIAKVVSLR